MKIRQVASGLATYIPGLAKWRQKSTGGTDSARYCYTVWARHLVLAAENGLNAFPETVAELGPGDSLGIGMAALISGSERYFGLDVIEHASVGRNLEIFDELVRLFVKREGIPGDDEFPDVKPRLRSYEFPAHVYDDSRLARALKASRLTRIREAVRGVGPTPSIVDYRVPWFEPEIIDHSAVDMVFSQAVLEHVTDLKNAYRAMHMWLRSGGVASHQIDFRCHGTADEWNGHWKYSDFEWKLIEGRRTWLLNREPHSAHVRLLTDEGFKIVCDRTVSAASRLERSQLAERFKSIPDEDLTTSGAFIQAVKARHGQ